MKDLPVEDPGRLVMVSDPNSAGVSIGTQTGVRGLFTYEEFARMRARNQVFSGMFAAESHASRLNVSISGGSLEEVAHAARNRRLLLHPRCNALHRARFYGRRRKVARAAILI